MFALQLQASQYRNEPNIGRSYTGLHEPARHDLQYVWPDAQGDLILSPLQKHLFTVNCAVYFTNAHCL